jgi:hypothetical protein
MECGFALNVERIAVSDRGYRDALIWIADARQGPMGSHFLCAQAQS